MSSKKAAQGLKAYSDVFLGEYVDGKLNLMAY